MSQGTDRLLLLQTFIRIVEAGSLSAAATQMNTTQPTISRRLQTLERSLGLHLIQRSTHALKLTEAGQRYYERSRELISAWGEFEADLRGSVDEPQGILRVVVPHAFGQHQLIGPLTEYLSRYPKISVEWLLHDTPPNFIEEGIDCAIRVGGEPDPLNVVVRLGEVGRILVASPRLLQNIEQPQSPKILEKLPWLALSPYYRNELLLRDSSGTECRLQLLPRVVTDSLYALRSAALRDVGVAALSAWVVQEDLAEERLIHILPDWHAPALPVYLVYPHAAFYPAKLRMFVDVMNEALEEIPKVFRRSESRHVPRETL